MAITTIGESYKQFGWKHIFTKGAACQVDVYPRILSEKLDQAV